MAISQSHTWTYWNPSSDYQSFYNSYTIDHANTNNHGFHFDNPELDIHKEFHESQHAFEKKFANFIPLMLSFSVLRPSHSANEVNSLTTRRQNSIVDGLNTIYEWKVMDFEYPSIEEREFAISSKSFIPENILPLGLDTWKDKVFVTIPRWKMGVPATLTVLPRTPLERSPKLRPYPSWDWNSNTDTCFGLTSVFRLFVDSCDRLWVLDSGQINVLAKPKQVCPPFIMIFDLNTDKMIMKYELPSEFVKEDSLYTNIAVDIRDGKCNEAFAYLTDVWRYGLLVFDLKNFKSWRLTHGLFYPDPLFTRYQIDDLVFHWNDGIFGLTLTPYDSSVGDRLLIYHPMSSGNEFYVKTSIIRNETIFQRNEDEVHVLGENRGASGHSSASGMDRKGVLFFNLVTRNSIGCWDSRKPYKRSTLGVVAQDNNTLIFPNDMKIDQERKQSVWVLSNRLPFYLYRGLNKNDYNFRILSGFTDDVVKNTICDPNVPYKSDL